jgi:hypothetical protein
LEGNGVSSGKPSSGCWFKLAGPERLPNDIDFQSGNFAVLYLNRQPIPLPAKTPRITVAKSSNPRNMFDEVSSGNIDPSILIENFVKKMDIESIKGIQLPGISILLFCLSNRRVNFCICEKPMKNPKIKHNIQKRIEIESVYLLKKEKSAHVKKTEGIASSRAKGTIPVFLALRPPMSKRMNRGPT